MNSLSPLGGRVGVGGGRVGVFRIATTRWMTFAQSVRLFRPAKYCPTNSRGDQILVSLLSKEIERVRTVNAALKLLRKDKGY